MRKLILLGFLILSACAGVSFRQLDPSDLRAKAGAPEGAVYYLPRPYLLVTRLPQTGAGPVQPSPVANVTPPPSRGGARRRGQDAQSPLPIDFTQIPMTRGGAETPAASAATSLGASDQSFSLVVGNYAIKLVYLPDMSRPMSMSVRSGLFGVSSLNPTLQNGWMLTDFEASAENSGFADVLNAVAGLINTGVLGGATGGAAAAGGGGASAAAVDGEVLPPGLYDFDFDAETGRLTRLCSISLFTSQGVRRGDCAG